MLSKSQVEVNETTQAFLVDLLLPPESIHEPVVVLRDDDDDDDDGDDDDDDDDDDGGGGGGPVLRFTAPAARTCVYLPNGGVDGGGGGSGSPMLIALSFCFAVEFDRPIYGADLDALTRALWMSYTAAQSGGRYSLARRIRDVHAHITSRGIREDEREALQDLFAYYRLLYGIDPQQQQQRRRRRPHLGPPPPMPEDWIIWRFTSSIRCFMTLKSYHAALHVLHRLHRLGRQPLAGTFNVPPKVIWSPPAGLAWSTNGSENCCFPTKTEAFGFLLMEKLPPRSGRMIWHVYDDGSIDEPRAMLVPAVAPFDADLLTVGAMYGQEAALERELAPQVMKALRAKRAERKYVLPDWLVTALPRRCKIAGFDRAAQLIAAQDASVPRQLQGATERRRKRPHDDIRPDGENAKRPPLDPQVADALGVPRKRARQTDIGNFFAARSGSSVQRVGVQNGGT